jgi:ribosome maturation factor RimP
MYWEIPARLLGIVEPIARDHGLEIVDARFGRGPGRALLRIIVDNEQGDGRVTVDACAAFSREVGRALDVAEFSSAPYMLEVTSPGVDRTLAREIDFVRAVGRRIHVETRRSLGGQRRFRGELVEFAGGALHLQTDAKRVQIPLEAVARANAVYTGRE